MKVKFTKDQTKVLLNEDASANPNRLREVLATTSRRGEVVLEARLDVGKLERVLQEWKILGVGRNNVEVEILRFFDNRLPETTFAVTEIKKVIKASAPSVQRALKALVRRELLTKPGRGVYRRNFK